MRQPLLVPQRPNHIWSADFMSDALYVGSRFRTFNVIDDFNREAVAIEIDTSLTARRLIRVFERLQATRGLPDVIRVDNVLTLKVKPTSGRNNPLLHNRCCRTNPSAFH